MTSVFRANATDFGLHGHWIPYAVSQNPSEYIPLLFLSSISMKLGHKVSFRIHLKFWLFQIFFLCSILTLLSYAYPLRYIVLHDCYQFFSLPPNSVSISKSQAFRESSWRRIWFERCFSSLSWQCDDFLSRIASLHRSASAFEGGAYMLLMNFEK